MPKRKRRQGKVGCSSHRKYLCNVVYELNIDAAYGLDVQLNCPRVALQLRRLAPSRISSVEKLRGPIGLENPSAMRLITVPTLDGPVTNNCAA